MLRVTLSQSINWLKYLLLQLLMLFSCILCLWLHHVRCMILNYNCITFFYKLLVLLRSECISFDVSEVREKLKEIFFRLRHGVEGSFSLRWWYSCFRFFFICGTTNFFVGIGLFVRMMANSSCILLQREGEIPSIQLNICYMNWNYQFICPPVYHPVKGAFLFLQEKMEAGKKRVKEKDCHS